MHAYAWCVVCVCVCVCVISNYACLEERVTVLRYRGGKDVHMAEYRYVCVFKCHYCGPTAKVTVTHNTCETILTAAWRSRSCCKSDYGLWFH